MIVTGLALEYAHGIINVERLIQQHKNAVYRQMVRVCGNQEDAEDVLVEAMVRAYQASSQLKDEAAFGGWLAIIGRRVCSKIRRKDALLPILQMDEKHDFATPDSSSPEAMALMQETHACVQEAIGSLPPNYRQVYQRREIDGIDANHVAEELGISVGNVKSRLHRARVMVRSYLDKSLCSM